MNESHKHHAAMMVHGTVGIAFYLAGLAGIALMFRSLWLCEWWHAGVSMWGVLITTWLGSQFIAHRNKLDADR